MGTKRTQLFWPGPVDRSMSPTLVCIWFCLDISLYLLLGLSFLMQKVEGRPSPELKGIFDELPCHKAPRTMPGVTIDTARALPSSSSPPSVFGSLVYQLLCNHRRQTASSGLTAGLPAPLKLRPAGSTLQWGKNAEVWRWRCDQGPLATHSVP